MAHELEIINGKGQMFSVTETPWHGLGTVVSNAPSIEDVLNLSGLNWSVELQPTFLADGTETKQKAIVRDSDKSILGYVGDRYRPLQNTEALSFFEKFHTSGLVDFETAGSLRNGQRIWIMAKFKENSEVAITKNDTVRKYLLLSNGHDGVMGIRVGFTPIRVVCANTLAAAHNEDGEANKLISVFHTKNTMQNLEAIRDIINTTNQSFEATVEQYKAMAKKQIKKDHLARYVDIVFYNSKQAETDREKLMRENMTENITRLFEYGHGNQDQDVRGSVWALYNGVTQYLSYEAGRSSDTRLNNLWFGTAKNVNQKAFDTAMKIVVAA